MLSDNDIKEELSYAYVHAVAANAGFACDRPAKDRDSIDCKISAHGFVRPDSILFSPCLGIQLKATAVDNPRGPYLSFDLDIKNYNDLRARRSYPTLLVVYAMPIDKKEWLLHTTDSLTCRHGAYWCNLSQAPESRNRATQVVHVPTANQFSPETLMKIMYRASKYEDIGNGF